MPERPQEPIEVFTDGACSGNPGPGSWAAVIRDQGQKQSFSGRSLDQTTNQRMEITAAIEGLAHTPPGSQVILHSDSQYVIYTMSRGWKRKANQDLWARLDAMAKEREVRWEWRERRSTPELAEADDLAAKMAGGNPGSESPTPSSRVRMVDVSEKPPTVRVAVARGSIFMQPATLEAIRAGKLVKGDVLAVAQTAGIMAAKRTPDLIPLCHPLLIEETRVELALDAARSAVDITASVKVTGKTGAEMEALTAVAAAALTIYDMAKGIDPGMRIGDIRLTRKSGGKSGEVTLE